MRAEGSTVGDLLIDARFVAGSSDVLAIDDDAVPFVRDLVYAARTAAATNWVPATARGSTWSVPCKALGCRVRYRFALRESAARLNDAETAIASGEVLVAPPSTWLVHPEPPRYATDGARFRFHVHVDPPGGFAAGTLPAADGELDAFEAPTEALEGSSFAVFGPFHYETIRSGAARVEVAIAPHGLALSNPDAVAWVRAAVDAIAAYFGRFPAERSLVVLLAGQGDGPTRGVTMGDGGPAVLVRAGSQVTARTTREDWIVTHELLHVSLPSLSREHGWLSEGLATYVEPIVRARAGLVTPEKFWRDLVEGLPQGLPETGDEGLERTHTWGRTYWGGALYCLLADVTIRERTGGARSLDDALRGIVATGADVEAHWPIERFLEVGDEASGTSVLRDLYRDMALAPGTVDLAALWSRLGVRVEGDRVQFDDKAPLALARRAITGSRAGAR